MQQNNDTRVIQKAYETETSQALLSTVLYPRVKRRPAVAEYRSRYLSPEQSKILFYNAYRAPLSRTASDRCPIISLDGSL